MHVCTNAITFKHLSEDSSSEDRVRSRASLIVENAELKRENARLKHALEQRKHQ